MLESGRRDGDFVFVLLKAKLLMSRTSGHSQKMTIFGIVMLLHLLFLLYLHFAYHHVVEGIFHTKMWLRHTRLILTVSCHDNRQSCHASSISSVEKMVH